MDTIVNDLLQKQSIFRVGEVLSVNGREVCIKVDKNKNLMFSSPEKSSV